MLRWLFFQKRFWVSIFPSKECRSPKRYTILQNSAKHQNPKIQNSLDILKYVSYGKMKKSGVILINIETQWNKLSDPQFVVADTAIWNLRNTQRFESNFFVSSPFCRCGNVFLNNFGADTGTEKLFHAKQNLDWITLH